MLVEIWQNLLNVKPIGIYDTFFELGGHSLLAIQVVARIKEQLQVDLPVRYLLQSQTIADIAEIIAQSS
jgi:acyl carrier protein